MKLLPKSDSKPLGLIWVACPPLVVITGLVRALGEQARVHFGERPPGGVHFGEGPPGEVPSSVILYASGQEDLSESIERNREASPDKPPILVFGPHLDLALARDALQAAASAFVHAGMMPNQLLRAVVVATKGELVAPGELLNASPDKTVVDGYPPQHEMINLCASLERRRA